MPPGASGRHAGERLLLAAALVAFGAVLAGYLTYMAVHPPSWTLNLVDLHVYRDGGLVARHAVPPYSPHRAAPLYEWRGYGSLRLKFTYPPFAAAVFALLSYLPWAVLAGFSVAASLALLVAALWFTLGGLGYRRNRLRLAATLLIAALVLWTEPVLRTVYLGQVNLALMALIVWDLSQPDTKASRWWKGAGVGIAAGIKLIPLIFIPYLLLTHRFRQAALACGAFAATVLAGFLVLPADSARWWLHGLFLQTGRTGFIGWEGNQSLPALITRLSGSIAAGKPIWLAAAAVTAVSRPGLRGHAGQGWAPDGRAAGMRAHRAAGIPHQLGPPLGVDRPGGGGGCPLRGRRHARGGALEGGRVLRAGGRDCRAVRCVAGQPVG